MKSFSLTNGQLEQLLNEIHMNPFPMSCVTLTLPDFYPTTFIELKINHRNPINYEFKGVVISVPKSIQHKVFIGRSYFCKDKNIYKEDLFDLRINERTLIPLILFTYE